MSQPSWSRVWLVVVVAVSGAAAGAAALYWTRIRELKSCRELQAGSKKPVAVSNGNIRTLPDQEDGKVSALPCLLSLIEALQEHAERLQLELGEIWDDWMSAVLRALDETQSILNRGHELTRGQDTPEVDVSIISDEVANVLDRKLVPLLRGRPNLSVIMDSYIPRLGESWEAFLKQSKTSEERRFYNARSSWQDVKLQEKILVDSIEVLKCCLERSRVADASRGSQGNGEALTLTVPFEVVKVFYATDRAITADAEFLGRMSARETTPYGRALQYGWIDVALPDGDRKQPNKRAFEEGDPSKHITIFSIDTSLRGNSNRFLNAINEDLKKEKEKFPSETPEVLIYIHGYRNSHLRAVKSAALIKHDLRFRGVVILYSWSSKGTLDGYFSDGNNVKATTSSFRDFLKDVVVKGKCNIIAHSMGSRALIEALGGEQLILSPSASCPLTQIILVAADEERPRFEKLVKKMDTLYDSSPQPGEAASTRATKPPNPCGSRQARPHLTLYCSTEDWALWLSREVNSTSPFGGNHRLGDTTSLLRSKETLNFAGQDVIDVTGVMESPERKSWLHSYHIHSPAILRDIKVLLTEKMHASERSPTVTLTHFKGRMFYAFKPEHWEAQRSSCTPFGAN